MPDALIRKLFEHLMHMYGVRWLDQWDGMDLDKVRADWAWRLRDCSPAMIARGLDTMTFKHPPNAPEFSDHCRQFRPRHLSSVELVKLPRQQAPAGTFQRLHDILGDIKIERDAS